MLMTIRYRNGLRVDAVLLAANRDRMRIAIPSRRDTAELHRLEARWFMDDGAEIEIEAFIPLAGTGIFGFCAQLYPRTVAANGSMLA